MSYYDPRPPQRYYDAGDTHEAIYGFVVEFIADKGYSPTIRQIGAAVGIRSSSTTHKFVEELVTTGRLERDDRLSRTLRPVE